ncbi:MAG: hypothetical protein LBR64_06650 [Dysgonamonadaceae bacterium]|jgi:hypothetical protein|nr:hypothetical protein [Dysgonamonadaceae bacterium]
MKPNKEIIFLTPNTSEFYRECLAEAVSFRFDRMPDNSWRRFVSDITPEEAFARLDQITSHTLRVCEHSFDEENERWGAQRHLEMSFELREGDSTYIFSAEINIRRLDCLTAKYLLKPL